LAAEGNYLKELLGSCSTDSNETEGDASERIYRQRNAAAGNYKRRMLEVRVRFLRRGARRGRVIDLLRGLRLSMSW